MSGASEASGPHCCSEGKVKQDHCIMYHGTTLKAARRIQRYGFIPSTDGSGVYVSRNFQKAVDYPRTAKRSQRLAILRLKVSLGRVLEINGMDHPLRKSWHQAGYDAAWFLVSTLTGKG